MADETVANLGFAVDSKPLDDAKQKLGDLASQADKTGKAVDDLNQKTAKTGPAIGTISAPAKELASGLSATAQAAQLAGTSSGWW